MKFMLHPLSVVVRVYLGDSLRHPSLRILETPQFKGLILEYNKTNKLASCQTMSTND